jgi:hypothetical protein
MGPASPAASARRNLTGLAPNSINNDSASLARPEVPRQKQYPSKRGIHTSQFFFDSDQLSSVPLSLQSRLIHSYRRDHLLLPPTPRQTSPTSTQTKAYPNGLYIRLPSRKSTRGAGNRRNDCPLPPLKAFALFADRSFLCPSFTDGPSDHSLPIPNSQSFSTCRPRPFVVFSRASGHQPRKSKWIESIAGQNGISAG